MEFWCIVINLSISLLYSQTGGFFVFYHIKYGIFGLTSLHITVKKMIILRDSIFFDGKCTKAAIEQLKNDYKKLLKK